MADVRSPDGRTWKVGRRWLPRRVLRWRRAEVDPLTAFDVADASVSGVVIGLAIGAIFLLAVLVAWPLLALAFELILALLLLVGGVIGRVLFRRPWRIVARTAGPPPEELAWDVVGWRASREAMEHAASALRAGAEPRPAGAVAVASAE